MPQPRSHAVRFPRRSSTQDPQPQISNTAHHLNGNYWYTSDLVALDSLCPNPTESRLPDKLCTILTPLKYAAWAQELQHMPDEHLVSYLLSGMHSGF